MNTLALFVAGFIGFVFGASLMVILAAINFQFTWERRKR